MGKVQEIRESEKGQKIVQKGKNGIFHIIFGRTGIIFLLFDSAWYFIFCRFRKIAGICGLCILGIWAFIGDHGYCDHQPAGKSRI